jgi:hypothetical protein
VNVQAFVNLITFGETKTTFKAPPALRQAQIVIANCRTTQQATINKTN